MNTLLFGAVCVLFSKCVTGAGLFDVVHFEKTLEKEADKVHRFLNILSPKNDFKPVEILKQWKSSHMSNVGTFSWKDCGQAGDVMFVKRLSLSPDPVRLPGTLSVGFELSSLKTVASPLEADLLLEKKVGAEYIKLPCVGQIGSCHYIDFCQILSLIPACPPEFIQRGIPCKCPIMPGDYNLPNITFALPAIPLLPGDYHAKFDLNYLGAHVGCLELYASIANGF